MVVGQDVQDCRLVKELLRIICKEDLKIGIHSAGAVGVGSKFTDVLLGSVDLSLSLVHLLLRTSELVLNLGEIELGTGEFFESSLRLHLKVAQLHLCVGDLLT